MQRILKNVLDVIIDKIKQHNTTQHNTAQHNAMQYNTMQYTTQHNNRVLQSTASMEHFLQAFLSMAPEGLDAHPSARDPGPG